MNLQLSPSLMKRLVPNAAVFAAGLLGHLLLTQSEAVAADAPAAQVIAAAPGWVDVEGGVQHLAARGDGILLKLVVQPGDQVKAGAVLAQIDPTALELERDGAQLDTQRAQQQLEALQAEQAQRRAEAARLRPLVEQQAEPADALRQLEAQVAALDHQRRMAQTTLAASRLHEKAVAAKLAQLQLRAPSDGEILRVQARAGEAVTAGTPLLWFAGNGPLLVRAELDERLFGKVQPGMPAEVSPEYDATRVFPARVLRIARIVGPVQGLPDVRASAQDDRVVECLLSLDRRELLIGQRVLVRIRAPR